MSNVSLIPILTDCSRSTQSIQMPKSFAFDRNEVMYLIDGNKIKSIDQLGAVRTLVGSADAEQDVYAPMGCGVSFPAHSMRFYWPTVLRINPVDGGVYVLDEQVVYRLTAFDTVEVVLGAPYGCAAARARLHAPIDMAFDSEGGLFVLENDGGANKKVA